MGTSGRDNQGRSTPARFPAPAYQSCSAQTPYVGEWNAEVNRGGAGLLGLDRTFGRMRLEAGVLSFTPDDALTPEWSVPSQMAVGR